MKPDLTFLPECGLTKMQRALIRKLSAGNVVPTKELMVLWPERGVNALNMVLHGLRKKLKPYGHRIVNHRGLGYSLVRDVGEEVPQPSGVVAASE